MFWLILFLDNLCRLNYWHLGDQFIVTAILRERERKRERRRERERKMQWITLVQNSIQSFSISFSCILFGLKKGTRSWCNYHPWLNESLISAFLMKMGHVNLFTLQSVKCNTILLKVIQIVHTSTLKFILKWCSSFWLTTSLYFLKTKSPKNMLKFQWVPIVCHCKQTYLFIRMKQNLFKTLYMYV